MLSNLDSLAIFNETFDSLKTGDFEWLDNIEELSIEDNQITSTTFYDGIFDNMSKLRELWLFGNGLTALREDVFANNINLTDISLADNALTDLESGTFSTLTKLDGLGLHNNEMVYFSPTVFNGLSNLTYLRLSGNNIGTFGLGTFKDLAKLTSLYIENNNITTLPTGIFEGLESLIRLNLTGNPGSPFSVPVKLVRDSDNHLKYSATCDYYAPFELKLAISIQNGHAVDEGTTTITSYVTINAGEKTSNVIEVVPDANSQGDVTIDMTLPSLPSLHRGYALQKVNDYSLVQSVGRAPIALPKATQAFANYPNPFNPETWIPYQLATDSSVILTIYNINGIVVRQIKIGTQSAGYYNTKSKSIYWDGQNNSGESVASGIYLYRIDIDSKSFTKKMILLK